MDLKEQEYSVLIVSAADKFNTSLTQLLPEFKYSPVHVTTRISGARRAVLEREYDFIIINSPYSNVCLFIT